METAEELKNWVIKMGYNGRIPKNLNRICDASTIPLWRQVMDVVKPREEIRRIRNNIIIDHYKKVHIVEVNRDDPCEMKEIRVWSQKAKLEKQVADVQEQIQNVESKIKALEEKNKIKHLSEDNLKKNIQQHRQCIYLLQSKYKALEQQISDVETILQTVTNLTPIELDYDEHQAEVLDTLKQCTKKLEQIIQTDEEEKTSSFQNFQISGANKMNDSLGLLTDHSFNVNSLLLSSSPFAEKRHKTNLYSRLADADKVLDLSIKDLLYHHSRSNIWNSLHVVDQHDKNVLMNLITQTQEDSKCRKEDVPVAMLYGKHVEYEIKIVELQANIKNLEIEAASLQTTIFNELSEKYPSASSDLAAAINEKRKEVGLLSQVRHLQNRINLLEVDAKSENDVLKVEVEVQLLHDEITSTLDNVRQKYDVFEQFCNDMKQMCIDNTMQVSKLKRFTGDLDWTQDLLQNLALEEINTFLRYPLGHNKQRLSDYVHGGDLDSNTLLMLITLIGSPWSPPELLLINMLKAKHKLTVLKSLQLVENNVKEYTVDDLHQQESYVTYAIDKIKSMIASHSETEQRLKTVKKCLDLWVEMPFKAFVSPKRIVDKFDYQHYEDLYEKYYNSLS